MRMMKTHEVLPFFNGKKSELAKALGLSRAAITRWGDTVPTLQYMRLRYEIMPEAFKKNGELRKQAA